MPHGFHFLHPLFLLALPPLWAFTAWLSRRCARAGAWPTTPSSDDIRGSEWPIKREDAADLQAQGMGAENIAIAGSVSQAFSLLMASPPHRSNILNPYETQIGVGVVPTGSGYAISELFIGPNS